MALVQYDFGSSDSGSENEDSETTEVTKPVSVELPPTELHKKRSLTTTDSEKNSKKIRIAIPKIVDDITEDDPSETMIPKPISRVNSEETSGLLTKLPPPKNAAKQTKTTSFVPHTVTRKPVAPNKAKILAAKAKLKQKEAIKAKTDNLSSILDNENDDSDEDDEIITSNFDPEIWSQICGRRPKAKNPPPTISKTITSDQILEDLPPEDSSSSLKLDNDAFKQLVGGSKRRGLPSNVTITDIVESDMIQKTDVWMRKALTDPQYQQKHTSAEDDDDEHANPVAKNKHHITFLAHQAKAKEQELQAQWASGNQKRQMSRAKYGF